VLRARSDGLSVPAIRAGTLSGLGATSVTGSDGVGDSVEVDGSSCSRASICGDASGLALSEPVAAAIVVWVGRT
jgi:hypothetical protein